MKSVKRGQSFLRKRAAQRNSVFGERKKARVKNIPSSADFTNRFLHYIIYIGRSSKIRCRRPLSRAANDSLFWWLESRCVFSKAQRFYFL